MKNLKVKIYADGADVNLMLKEYDKGLVKGFTTNPSLMKKAGVKDYKSFGKEVVSKITDSNNFCLSTDSFCKLAI